MEYREGIGFNWGCPGVGASDTRWSLNASSTLGPVLETGLGAASAARRTPRKALEFVRARSAHSSLPPPPRLGSIWNEGWGMYGALIEGGYGPIGYGTPANWGGY